MAFGTVKVDALESAVKTVQVGQIVAVSGVASGESPVWNGTTWEGDVIEGETNLSYVTSTRTLNSSTGSGVILPLVTTSGDGLSSATDKAKLNGIASGATANIGTVTSIELTAPSGLVVSGGPITGSGTLTLAYASGFQAFTESESTKLAGVASGAEVNVNADWNAGSGDAQILNKPTLGTAAATNSTDYAPAAQGVTNGNSHDHSGGDGAQIAYSSLSGLPSIPTAADGAPSGLAATAAVGVSTDYAREDHQHQRDADVIVVPVGDESTALTTGTGKIKFRMPFAATLLAVRAAVNTAPTGSTLIVDINEAGVSVLGTKLSIDASELTSTTAASAATITDSSLADDAEISIDIDQIGSTVAGAGLKVSLFVRRA
jgi:hypothetical protein